jgi:hypothetical protein
MFIDESNEVFIRFGLQQFSPERRHKLYSSLRKSSTGDVPNKRVDL